jgi:hypothetical protein
VPLCRLCEPTFSTKSVLNEGKDSSWSLSPHPSPQGEPQVSENTLQEKELKSVCSSALPPTASVFPQGFTALRLAHASAPGKPIQARTRSPSAREEFRETFGTKFALFIAGIVALIGMAVALYLAIL